MSDTETLDGGRTSPTHGGRHEKSLGLLTSKFVDLLQAAEGGVLDLKKVHTTIVLYMVLLSIEKLNDHCPGVLEMA